MPCSPTRRPGSRRIYPAAFMAAVMSADIDDTDKVAIAAVRMRAHGTGRAAAGRQRLGVRLHGRPARAVHPLWPGRRARRGRRARSRRWSHERARKGPYASLAELCRRIDLTRVNRRVLEALIKAGAMDGLGANRATLMASLDAAVQGGEAGHARQRSRAGRPVRRRHRRRRASRGSCRSGPSACAWPASARRWVASSPGIPSQRYESDLQRLVIARLARPAQRATTGLRRRRRARAAAGRSAWRD